MELIVIAFFVALIGLVLFSSGLSIVVGLFISIFVGIFTAIKSCVLGIHRSISNMFIKVVLYIVVSLCVLAIVAPLGYIIVTLILSLI